MAVEIRPPEPPAKWPKRGGLLGLLGGSQEQAVLSDIKRTTALLAKKDASLTQHEKALNQLDANITKREEQLRSVAEKLRKQENGIKERQRMLDERERRIRNAEEDKGKILRERDAIQREMQRLAIDAAKQEEDLKRRREEARAQIAEMIKAQDDLFGKAHEQENKRQEAVAKKDAELRSQIEAKKQELKIIQRNAASEVQKVRDAQAQLDKETKLHEQVKDELAEAQRLLDQQEKSLAEEQAELKSIKKTLLLKTDELDKREKEFVQRELVAAQRSHEMANLRDQLAREKEEISTVVAGKKAEMADMQQQWDERTASLKAILKEIKDERAKAESLVTKDMVALSEKENEIVSSVKDMEKDERKLRKEEIAITKRVEELEHAQREFDRTKKVFDHKIDEFGEREKEIREREDYVVRAVADVEKAQERAHAAMDKIKRTKELHQNIELLERHQKELEATIQSMSRKIIALGHKQPVVAPVRVKVKEEPVVEHEEPVLDVVTPGPMSPMPVKEVHHRAPPADPVQLVANARRDYEAGNYKEAHAALLKAEHLLPKLKGEAKRDLAYDIWDLKTSLRLVTLA